MSHENENNNENLTSEKRKNSEDNDIDNEHVNKKPNLENNDQNETCKQMETEGESQIEPILFNGQDINSLSKSQMKKYKKMLSWIANKKDKRKKEKQRAKERKIEARKNNIDLGPNRKQLKLNKLSDSPCKTSVIIDLSFDELMIPKVKSLKYLNNKYNYNFCV